MGFFGRVESLVRNYEGAVSNFDTVNFGSSGIDTVVDAGTCLCETNDK
jgi:hypothetical protein